MQLKMTKYAFLYRKCLHFYKDKRIIQTAAKLSDEFSDINTIQELYDGVLTTLP